MSSPVSLALVLDDPDQALRPLRGRVEIRAGRSERVTLELRLQLHVAGDWSKYSRDVATAALPSAELVAESAELPFELPAQHEGWSFSDRSAFRCDWRLEATVRTASEERETRAFLLRQVPPEDARLWLEPETPPRLELISTRSFAHLLLFGGLAALGMAAVVLGRWWLESGGVAFGGVMLIVLVLIPLTDAIKIFRQQGKLGSVQFAVEQRRAAGYRELQDDQTLHCTAWVHPGAAVETVDLALRVLWQEKYKRPHTRSAVKLSEHVCHFDRRVARLHGPGQWRAALPLPVLSSVPPPLAFEEGNFLRARWQLEAHIRMKDGSLERVEMPLVARLALEGAEGAVHS